MCNRAGQDPVTALVEAARMLRAARPVPLATRRPPQTMEEKPASPAQRIAQEMVEIRRVIDLIELEFSYRAAEFATTDWFEQTGSTSAADWMRHNCRMTGHSASLALCVGQEMPHLEQTVKSMESGEIGRAHLALMARTSASIARRREPDAFDEAGLLAKAKQQSPGRFRFSCEHYKHAADQDAFLDDHLTLAEKRKLQISSCSDGMVSIKALLDPVGGATFRTALEPLARRNGIGDTRPREKRLADAAVELAHHALDRGALPTTHQQRPHLLITASIETVQALRGSAAGDLEYSSPLPAATVQRLACDSVVSRLILNAKSEIVDVGRKQRTANAAIRRTLTWRDQGCVWPGCDRPPTWTAAHHVDHWANGGATDLDNLVLVCHRHHQMVHEGGWRIERSRGGEISVGRPGFGGPSAKVTRKNIRAPAA